MHEPLFTFPLLAKGSQNVSLGWTLVIQDPKKFQTMRYGFTLYINVVTMYFQNVMVIFLDTTRPRLNQNSALI